MLFRDVLCCSLQSGYHECAYRVKCWLSLSVALWAAANEWEMCDTLYRMLCPCCLRITYLHTDWATVVLCVLNHEALDGETSDCLEKHRPLIKESFI